MIHQLLSLTRPLFVLDTETTGLDVQKDRIIELGFQQWEPEGDARWRCPECSKEFTTPHRDLPGMLCGEGHNSPVEMKRVPSVPLGGMTKEYRTLVNPGVPIPASATKVHGITDAMVQGCRNCGELVVSHPVSSSMTFESSCYEFKPWPKFAQLAPNLAKGFTDCDFAGKNVRFDLRILAAEMQRAGVPWSAVGARIIDADALERIAVPRSLSHLYRKYMGQDLVGAHGALADVKATEEVISAQLQRYEALPKDLDALHELSWPGWLCDGGQFKMIDGVAVCQFGKWRGVAMKKIDVSYYDWLLKSDFPADVKALAAQAKLGNYPGDDK